MVKHTVAIIQMFLFVHVNFLSYYENSCPVRSFHPNIDSLPIFVCSVVLISSFSFFLIVFYLLYTSRFAVPFKVFISFEMSGATIENNSLDDGQNPIEHECKWWTSKMLTCRKLAKRICRLSVLYYLRTRMSRTTCTWTGIKVWTMLCSTLW